jgi:putative transposase
VHLLLTPQTADAISRMMQALGRRYVAVFNRRHGRSGTLWAGRFASHLVDEAAVLDCQCYIEMVPPAPARKRVNRPGRAPRTTSGRVTIRWSRLTVRSGRWATPFEREAAYRARLEQGLPAATRQAIEQAMRSGLLLGDESARRALERELHRSLAPAPGAPGVRWPSRESTLALINLRWRVRNLIRV